MNSPHAPNLAYYDAVARDYSLFFRDFDHSMEAEGEWLDELLKQRGAQSVLDASCGTGRQAIPLARLGYEVVGADPSSEMLAVASETAQRLGVDLRLVPASFTELPGRLGTRFDLVISMGNGMCNLTGRQEIRAALSALRRCCRPEGACLIGIKDFDQILSARPRFNMSKSSAVPGCRGTIVEIWDYGTQELVVTAHILRARSCGAALWWTSRPATTHEYPLTERELRTTAAEVEFVSVTRLPHPAEAVFLLLP